MADFARIADSRGVSLRINLDHVTRISPGLDPREPATVRFAAGAPSWCRPTRAGGGSSAQPLLREAKGA